MLKVCMSDSCDHVEVNKEVEKLVPAYANHDIRFYYVGIVEE